MNRFSYWMLALIGAISVGLISSTSVSRAADSSANTGSITGKVVDASGNAVGGAMVRLIEIPAGMQQEKHHGRHHRAPNLQPGQTRWMTVGMTITADDGTFTANHAPAGKYRIMVFSRGAGHGFVHKPVEVTAGGTADAGTITLKNGGRHGHGHKGHGPPPPPGGN